MPRGLTFWGEESWEQALRWSVREKDAGEAGVVEFVDELMLLLRLCACEGGDFMRLPLLFQNQPVLDCPRTVRCRRALLAARAWATMVVMPPA